MKVLRSALLAAGMLAAGAASAQDQGRGPGYGPGSGPGYGPGMMGGGGYGRGQGMMGGNGFGPGGGIADLSAEQREKMALIRENNRRKNWDTMGQLQSEQFKLRQLYYAEKTDPSAITEQQKKVDELRRQMLRSRLEARKEIEAVLTAEQRKQLRNSGPWWMHGEENE